MFSEPMFLLPVMRWSRCLVTSWRKEMEETNCETENILDFRLSRIASLTGIRPGTTSSLQFLLRVLPPPSLTCVYQTSQFSLPLWALCSLHPWGLLHRISLSCPSHLVTRNLPKPSVCVALLFSYSQLLSETITWIPGYFPACPASAAAFASCTGFVNPVDYGISFSLVYWLSCRNARNRSHCWCFWRSPCLHAIVPFPKPHFSSSKFSSLLFLFCGSGYPLMLHLPLAFPDSFQAKFYNVYLPVQFSPFLLYHM